jgi:magnesium chelatase subunit D
MTAPPSEFKTALDLGTSGHGVRRAHRASFSTRARSHASSPEIAGGRFYGDVTKQAARAVAFDATLRVAAERHTRASSRDSSGQQARFTVAAEDLRFKLFSRKVGTLFIFAVDTSGSMALNRIGQAKGALAKLLRRSYVNRDRVALVSFRAAGGEIVLRPTRSPALAKRLLDALSVGGATPLASGLLRVHEIALRAKSEGAERISLLVFTDGRANVALGGSSVEDRASRRRRIEHEIETIGERLRRAGVESTVVDTRARFADDGEGKKLARSLGGSYMRLPFAPAPATSR